MEQRQLGRSGLKVVPLCFGGNVFGWTIDQPTSHRVLDAFVDEGFNFIDTADVYSHWAPGNSGGESETIIGSWLKGRRDRDKLVIATKVGMEMGPGRKGLAPAYIRASVEDSLRRLQTDYIDLYQSHADDPETPFEDVLGTYQDLIDQGKVRAVGASNISAARLKEALDVSARTGLVRYESLQPEYNLFDRGGYEAELEPLCLEHGLGVITYYSLASGFLSGKYRKPEDASKSPRGERVVSKYLNDRAGHPGGIGRGGGTAQCHADAGGAGLGDRPPQRNRADRQRHQSGAIEGLRGCGEAEARSGVDQPA